MHKRGKNTGDTERTREGNESRHETQNHDNIKTE